MGRLAEFVRSRPKTSCLILLAALAALCVAASALIETRRETIYRTIKESIRALEEADVEGAVRHVARDFAQEGMNREDLRSLAASSIQTFGPPRVTILKKDFDLEEGKATCHLSVWSRFPQSRQVQGTFVRSRWRVSLRLTGNVWHLTEVTPLSVNDYQPGGLVPLARRYLPWP